ncbi:DMT family transporter [Achromobacter xylosoxidans]
MVQRAIAYKVASAALIAAMYGLIKTLSAAYPVGEIVFARSFFALAPILWQLHRLQRWSALRTRRPAAHALRSIFGLASLFLGFSAVSMLPLSTATALTYTAPLFVALFAMVCLREPVSLRRWTSLLLGFGGVVLVVDPDLSGGLPLGALLALFAALSGAAALVSIRSLASSEDSTVIAFYFSVTGAVIAAVSMVWAFAMPSPRDLLILVLVGLLGGVAQLLLTYAYHQAPASIIAPWEYATLIFASLIGYVVWGMPPARPSCSASASSSAPT